MFQFIWTSIKWMHIDIITLTHKSICAHNGTQDIYEHIHPYIKKMRKSMFHWKILKHSMYITCWRNIAWTLKLLALENYFHIKSFTLKICFTYKIVLHLELFWTFDVSWCMRTFFSFFFKTMKIGYIVKVIQIKNVI
jgi:hypothetical protein